MDKTKLQMVKEFNDEIVKLRCVRVARCLAPERVGWFKNVVIEELNEFEEAWKNNSGAEMLDALVDAAYFILGRVYECGFTESQWDKAFQMVHEANMKKHSGNKGRGSDMDAIKDKDWVDPKEGIKSMLQVDEEIETDFTNLDEVFPKPLDIIYPPLNEETMKPLNYSSCAINEVEHRKPSVYLNDDGEQRILSIDELNLFAKMSPVFKEVTELAIKKSKDYNNGNSMPKSRANYFPFGLLSYAQMLHIKSQRLNSLVQQDTIPNNESVRDTLLDMINYATFAVEAIDKGEV